MPIICSATALWRRRWGIWRKGCLSRLFEVFLPRELVEIHPNFSRGENAIRNLARRWRLPALIDKRPVQILRIDHPHVRHAHGEIIGDSRLNSRKSVLGRENLDTEHRWFGDDSALKPLAEAADVRDAEPARRDLESHFNNSTNPKWFSRSGEEIPPLPSATRRARIPPNSSPPHGHPRNRSRDGRPCSGILRAERRGSFDNSGAMPAQTGAQSSLASGGECV